MKVLVEWDDPDDPEGNVQHISRHNITPAEVEYVLNSPWSSERDLPKSFQWPSCHVWSDEGRQVFDRDPWNPASQAVHSETRHRLRNPTPEIEHMSKSPGHTPVNTRVTDEDVSRSAVEANDLGAYLRSQGLGDATAPRPAVGPDLDALIDSGDIDEPMPHGQFCALSTLVHGLKARREAQGLSLTDVAARSGLTRAAVSRLENGWNTNPTLETLYRYALALGAHLTLGAEDIETEAI